MKFSRIVFLLAALSVLLVGASLYLRADSSSHPSAADSDGAEAKAVLRNAAGDRMGTAKFEDEDDGVHVKLVVDAPLTSITAGFHGFHVHETGICDPNAVNAAGAASPFFTAGFHLDLAGTGSGGTAHPAEAGDLPVLLVNDNGAGRGVGLARFVTSRFTIAQLLEGNGTALIIHAGPDNYANIPSRYLTGTLTAVDQATKDTGDAGARKACGVIALE